MGDEVCAAGPGDGGHDVVGEGGDLCRKVLGVVGEVEAGHVRVAAGGGQQRRKQREGRRRAGPIRPDDDAQLVSIDRQQIDLERLEAVEAAQDVLQVHHVVRGGA